MKTIFASFISVLAALLLLPTALLAENPDYAGARNGSDDDPVARGDYLATAGNCLTCHSAPGGDAYAGGVAFTTEFGTLYASNITPDPTAGIGSWTEEEFVRAMRDGKGASGSNLFPAFPYPHYTKLTDQDISDIYAFLQTVTPSSSTPPENALKFPFNQRWLLGFWNFLNFESGQFEPDASKSAEWNRGAYLVEGLAHCGACHTPRGSLGGPEMDLALSGGVYIDEVPGGEKRKWSAPNLTSSLDGLGTWTEQDLVDYLSSGRSPMGSSLGPMNKVIEHGTSKLHLDDIKAMAVYLKATPSITRSPQHEMDPREFSRADILYTVHCGTCHLPTGLGDPTMAPSLKGNAVVQAADPSAFINIVIYGVERSEVLDGPKMWEKEMEPFKDKLDDEEIALISTYVRSNWGNYGGPVTEEDVAEQR